MNASSMAGDLRGFKDQLQENMLILFLGVDWLLDRISIQSEKTSLTVALNLDFNDLQSLMQLASRLRKIRELADRGDGGSGMPFDVPSNKAGEAQEGGGE